MFTISSTRMSLLSEASYNRFKSRLVDYLREQEPDFFRCFSTTVHSLIVHNMTEIAISRGVRWKSSIKLYCHLMLAVAPNFDSHPSISSFLYGSDADPNDAVLELADWMEPEVWTEAQGNRSDLALFHAPDLYDATLFQRTVAALTLFLSHRDISDSASVVAWAIELSAAWNLAEFEDSPLLIAAAWCLRGTTSEDLAAHGIAPAFGAPSSAERCSRLRDLVYTRLWVG